MRFRISFSPRMLSACSVIAFCAGCAAIPPTRADAVVPACPSALPEYGPDQSPLFPLKLAGIIPLCELPAPRGSDFTLRYTTFLFSQHGTYSYQARNGRLMIAIEDNVYDPPFRLQEVSRLPAAVFYEKLKEARIDDLWRADDPDCNPKTTVIAEFGSILEFYDASGYHARWSPRFQATDCTAPTPYSLMFKSINALVGELQSVPTIP